jgi:hypothetical protein
MATSRGRRRARWLLLGAVGAVVGLLLFQLPANALDVTATPTPVTGNATYFDGLGAPYGGCGLPQANLDSQDFVALNVFNTPGDYSAYARPLPPAQAAKLGMFDNGLNCGRFVQVSIGDYCTGTNDGAQNESFCRNGSWTSDAYNGATLTMVVADSCGDSNAWCRDDPYHLDLHKDSINRFVRAGSPVGDLLPNHWNNRHVSWQFVPVPGYTGDIQIGFLQGAQTWWGATTISHLPNGIHGVQYLANGTWQNAAMNGDMGESYILSPTTAGGTQFQIRVTDASDALVDGGRVYTFSLPSSCASQCGAGYTQVPYTTSGGTGTGGGTTTTTPPPTTTTTTAAAPSAACTATESITSSWTGGFQASVTVADTGSTPISGWSVSGTFPGPQTVASSWNATVTQSGQQVTATNASYNGTVPAGGATSWGMTVDGTGQPLANLACHT